MTALPCRMRMRNVLLSFSASSQRPCLSLTLQKAERNCLLELKRSPEFLLQDLSLFY